MKFWSTFILLLFVGQLFSQTIPLVPERAIERFSISPADDLDTYRVGPLQQGHYYRIELPAGFHGDASLEVLSGGSLAESATHFWEGVSIQPFLTLKVNSRGQQRLVVADLTIVNRAAPAPAGLSMTNIIPENNDDAEELVNSIFRNQSCFETDNHAYSGFYGLRPNIPDTISQLGTFTNGMSATGIEQGILMSTGRVDRAVGPNVFTGTTFIYNIPNSDPDLIQLSGSNSLFDVAIVEFDFTPTTDRIDFNYVFASEEYCEEITNNTVDVFAFLISGPGISGPFSNGAENIAVLPDGSSIDVTEINHLQNTAYYRSNVPTSFNEPCQTLPPVAENDFEYDGMTVLLTATSPVIPCETYHLKLIVADVGDQFYDSAVFLEAGSFAAGLVNVSEPGVTAEDAGVNNAPLEGCSDGILIFSRLDSSDISQPLTVYFNISPTGTATFGTDYTMPTDSFIIEAGQFSDTLLIDIFGDDLVEGTESIILRLEGTCNCAANTTEFFIVDPPLMTLDVQDPAVDCPGSFTDLIPTVNGGVGTYDFSWSTGSTDSILSVMYTPGDSLYILSVTDNCQQLLIDTVTVSAPDLTATLSGNYSLCDDPTAIIPVILTGAASYTIVVNEDGTDVSYTGGPDTIFLSYSAAISLNLVSVTADGCTGVATGSAEVTASTFTVTANLTNILCNGDTTGSILIDVNGTPQAYSYGWLDPDLSGNNPMNLPAGNYPVTISDAAGCTFDTIFTLTQPATPLLLQLDSIRNQACLDSAYLAVSASGGAGGIQFEWLDDGSSNPVRDGLVGNTNYSVVATDQNGCTDTMSYTPLDIRPTITATISGTFSLCDNPTATVAVVVTGATNYTITVTENGTAQTYSGGPDTIFLPYTSATNIVLIAVEAEGCTGTVMGTATVTQANFGLTAQLDTLDCFGDADGSIDISLNGNLADYTFNWADAGLSGNNPTSLTAENYPVTITDAAGCMLDTTFILTQPDALSLVLQSSNNQNCSNAAGATLSATGGNLPYTLDWGDGGANTLVRADLNGGQLYVVTLTDNNSCQTTLNVQLLDERRNMDATIGSATTTELTCANPSIHLGAAVNASPVTYEWQDQNAVVIGNQDSLTVTQPGTYQLIASDATTACSDTQTIVITQSGDFLDLDTGGPYVIDCSNGSVDLTATVTNFNGMVNYNWTDANGTSLGNSNVLADIMAPGNYTISAERVDNGCTSTATVNVTEDRTDPEVGLTVIDLACNNDTATLQVQTNNGSLQYAWSTADGNTSGPTDQDRLIALSTGTYSLRVTDLTNGCALDTFATVTEDARTLLALGGIDQLLNCGGNPLILNGSASPLLAGTGFRWLDDAGNVLAQQADYTPAGRGVFTLEVTHPESGCVSSDEVTVRQEGPASLELNLRHPPCVEVGGSISVQSVTGGDAPYTYFVDGEAAVFDGDGNISGLAEGSHQLTVIDANGCSFSEDVQIFTAGTFTGETQNLEIRLGEDAQLGFSTDRAARLDNIFWSAPVDLSCLNCPDPLAVSPVESFTARVILIDQYGCELALNQQVFVNRQDLIYAPNAISPYRPDGFNDKFTLYGDPRFVSSIDYLKVYNRWGGLVWEAADLEINNESQGWDGYFNERPLNGDAYVFSAMVTYFDGAKEVIKGSINILR